MYLPSPKGRYSLSPEAINTKPYIDIIKTNNTNAVSGLEFVSHRSLNIVNIEKTNNKPKHATLISELEITCKFKTHHANIYTLRPLRYLLFILATLVL